MRIDAGGISGAVRPFSSATRLRNRTTTTITGLARLLVQGRSQRALVLEHGRLVGIISTFDIVEELVWQAEPA